LNTKTTQFLQEQKQDYLKDKVIGITIKLRESYNQVNLYI